MESRGWEGPSPHQRPAPRHPAYPWCVVHGPGVTTRVTLGTSLSWSGGESQSSWLRSGSNQVLESPEGSEGPGLSLCDLNPPSSLPQRRRASGA